MWASKVDKIREAVSNKKEDVLMKTSTLHPVQYRRELDDQNTNRKPNYTGDLASTTVQASSIVEKVYYVNEGAHETASFADGSVVTTTVTRHHKIEELMQMFEIILLEEKSLEEYERKMIMDLLRRWLSDRTPQSKEDLLYTLGMIDRKNCGNVLPGFMQVMAGAINPIKQPQAKVEETHATFGPCINKKRPTSTTRRVNYIESTSNVKRVDVRPISAGTHMCHTDIERRRQSAVDHCFCNKSCKFNGCEYKCHECQEDCRHSYCLDRKGELEVNKEPILTKDEVDLWKSKRLLHCHYRGGYNNDNMKKLGDASKSRAISEKLKRKQAEEEKAFKREKLKEFQKSISETNKAKYRKLATEEAIKKTKTERFPWGPDERILKKPTPVKREKKPNPRPELIPKSPIQHIKDYKAKEKAKEMMKERLENIRKKKSKEQRLECRCKRQHSEDRAQIVEKKRQERSAKLKAEKLKKKEEQKKLKKTLEKIELERKANLAASKKKPLIIEEDYIFDCSNTNKNESQVKSLETQERKVRFEENQLKKIKEVAETINSIKPIPTPIIYEEQEPHHTPNVRHIERSTLMEAESKMLREISSSVHKIVEVGKEIEEIKCDRNKKTFEEHLLYDPQEAYENQFFGLRENTNYQYIHEEDDEDLREFKRTKATIQSRASLPQGSY